MSNEITSQAIIQDMMPVFNLCEFFKLRKGTRSYVVRHYFGWQPLPVKPENRIYINDLEKTQGQLKSITRKFIYFPIHHYVDSEDGFSEIFIREFKKSGAGSEEFFRDELIEQFKRFYLNPFNEYLNQSSEDFYRLYIRDKEIALKFLKWLQNLTPETLPKSDTGVLFNEKLVDKVYKKYNGVAFNSTTKSSLFDFLNFPENNEGKIQYKTQNNMMGIIKQLENIAMKTDDSWKDKILKAAKIKQADYRRKGKQCAKTVNFD